MLGKAVRPIVRPGDRPEAARLHQALDDFDAEVEPLVGLASDDTREVFVAQLIESQRRNRFIGYLLRADLTPAARDPASGAFDPLRAAVLASRRGDYDEACWLVFLSVHFGRAKTTGWLLPTDFYGRLGQGGTWDWASAIAHTSQMRDWLDAHRTTLTARGGRFGNHRKRESLDGWSPLGTGAVLSSYIGWVGDSHADRFEDFAGETAPSARFARLYASLASVTRFGRIARFDYLSMMGKLDLLDVVPDGLHLIGASGPQYGARLLLTGHPKGEPRNRELERRLAPLQDRLGVTFDVLEDALCNWQKSPSSFVSFRG